MLCISAEGSEQPAHDEWGGSSSLFRKAFSASREWCGITAAVRVAAQSCVCPTAVSCQAGVPMSVIVQIGGTRQSELGTGGVRLLSSRHHRCCRQVEVHG